MSKNIEKSPYIKIINNNQIHSKKPIFEKSKFLINSSYENKTIYIYNGLNFTKQKITSNMIGYKLGSFIRTRKPHKYKKKKKKKII